MSASARYRIVRVTLHNNYSHLSLSRYIKSMLHRIVSQQDTIFKSTINSDKNEWRVLLSK